MTSYAFLEILVPDLRMAVNAHVTLALCIFMSDTNCLPVNTASICIGALPKYRSLIDFICIPCELSDYVVLCEILVDVCLNASCHRRVLFSLNSPTIVCASHVKDSMLVNPNALPKILFGIKRRKTVSG